MTNSVYRSIRLIPKSPAELARLSGSSGEIFLDSATSTLRIFDGKHQNGVALLRADLSNLQSSGGSIDFGNTVVTAQGFHGPVTGNVTGNLTGNVTGNLTGNVTGNLTGLASTAAKWATPRTITLAGSLSGSVSIDGSSDVTLNATVNTNDIVLGTDTTGSFIAVGAVSGNGLSGSANSENATFTVTSNATASNLPSTIVFRDGSGNFAANSITASLTGAVTGNVTGNLTGAVTGNVTGDVASSGTSTFNNTTVQNMTVANNVIADTAPTAPAHLVNKRYTDNLLTAFSIAFGS